MTDDSVVRDRIRQQMMVRNPEYKDDDFDICECGDYRWQHENGAGKCTMRDDICHGFASCLKFRDMTGVK